MTGLSQYLTSAEDGSSSSGRETAWPPSSSYYSARIQHMIQRRNEYDTEVEFQIEASKDHWSKVVKKACSPRSPRIEPEEASNRHVFERLKEQWGEFFWDYGDRLVFGKKIAEGGQAEIFEAHVTFPDGSEELCRLRYVVKVMKGPCSLLSLQAQWPLGMLRKIKSGCPFFSDTDSCCLIWGATLLEDDRFAFVMPRYWGDLRTVIDMRIRHNHNQPPPFRDEIACISIMLQIAVAMEELHNHDILHRDIKAANVLVNLMDGNDDDDDAACFNPLHDDEFQCAVADFECSVGVVGTGYWRAPEVLVALKDRYRTGYPELLFTKKADVYSYAMTCYEILTGLIPLEGLRRADYKLVLDGLRPTLPVGTDPQLKTLIARCWLLDPVQRPTFTEIVKALDGIVNRLKLEREEMQNEFDEMRFQADMVNIVVEEP